MEQIKLSTRLQAIADLVPPGTKVADIGTDHGHIPVYLVQQGLSPKTAAADINVGPLTHAMSNAAEHGVMDSIQFALCDGLRFEGCCEYDTFIIAGMGGELIASILADAPWTKEHKTLILQPNSRIPVLVQWLQENGYAIHAVKLVKDAGKYYQMMVVRGGNSEALPDEADRLVHPLYARNRDPLLQEYLGVLLGRYESARKGMLSGKNQSPELESTNHMIERLTQMQKEAEAWQP